MNTLILVVAWWLLAPPVIGMFLMCIMNILGFESLPYISWGTWRGKILILLGLLFFLPFLLFFGFAGGMSLKDVITDLKSDV